MAAVEMWHLLGLDELQQGLYLAALNDPTRTVSAHATALHRTDAEVAEAAQGLVEMALLQSVDPVLAPLPPATALAALARRRQHELDATNALAAGLERVFNAGRAQAQTDELFTVYRGGPVILTMLRELVGSASTSMDLVDTPPYVGPPDTALFDAETAAVRRGVLIRTLYDHSAVDDPDHLKDMLRSVAEGQQVRLAARPSTKMVIIDRSVALVPLAIDLVVGEPQVAVIRHAELVGALSELFTAQFDSAFPLSDTVDSLSPGAADAPPTGDDPTAVDHQLLALLASGATDVAIARHLDISERTFRRRVATLSDRVGAKSRFQLGLMVERTLRSGDPE